MSDLPATAATASPATYDREKLQLIRDMFAKGANDNEFGVMVELARKYQLDCIEHFSEWWNAQKEATE